MFSKALGPDAKTYIHIALMLVAAVVSITAIHPLTVYGVIVAAAGVAGSIAVYLATNKSTGPLKYVKGFIAVAVPVIGAIVVALGSVQSHRFGDVAPDEWLVVGLQVLAALGVIGADEANTLETFTPTPSPVNVVTGDLEVGRHVAPMPLDSGIIPSDNTFGAPDYS